MAMDSAVHDHSLCLRPPPSLVVSKYVPPKIKCTACGVVSVLYTFLRTEAVFLDEIQTTVLRVFLLSIHYHLYSFALRFLFLQTRATSSVSTFHFLYTVREKGGKFDRKPYLLPYSMV